MERKLAQVLTVSRSTGANEPVRITAALSDGETVYAIRFSDDDHPPSLYWRNDDNGVLIVSEPLDADERRWDAMPIGHVLVAANDLSVRRLAA
jgi:glutamine amidotransferase